MRSMTDPTRRPSRKTDPNEGVQWKRWALGILVVLLLIVIFQNAQSVRFKFLFVVDTKAPLVLLLAGSALVGAVIGYAAPILRRHHRQTSRELEKD